MLSQFSYYWSNTCKLARCYSIFYCSKQRLKYHVSTILNTCVTLFCFIEKINSILPNFSWFNVQSLLHLVNEMHLNIKVLSNEVMLSEVKHPV